MGCMSASPGRSPRLSHSVGRNHDFGDHEAFVSHTYPVRPLALSWRRQHQVEDRVRAAIARS